MMTPTLDTLNDISPEKCSQVGLSCAACTRETARQLAAVCKGLRGKAVGQLFVQLYPSSGCAPMHGQFAAFYQEASVTRTDMDTNAEMPAEVGFERREVGSARGRLMAAVA